MEETPPVNNTTTNPTNVPTTNSNLTMSALCEYDVLSLKRNHTHVMCDIVAPMYASQTSYRAPVDLVAVVDKSGSMKGEKLNLVKEACTFIVQELQEDDCFCLITYDDNVKVDFPVQRMTEDNKKNVLDCIKAITDGSSTNLCGGLVKGIEEAKGSASGNKVSSIWLFTDGLANIGTTDRAGIIREMKRVLGATSSNTVYTFGFGGDHNVDMLNDIAEEGNGQYFFIKGTDDIGPSFADCLGGVLSVLAQDITLTIEPVGDTKIIKVLGIVKKTKNQGKNPKKTAPKKQVEDTPPPPPVTEEKKPEDTKPEETITPNTEENAPKPEVVLDAEIGDSNIVTVPIGDMYGEENRDIICLLNIAPHDTDEQPLIKFTLSYMNVITTENNLIECICNIRRVDISDSSQQIRNYMVDKQLNRLKTTDAIDRAKVLADNGDLDGARNLLAAVIQEISSSISAHDPFCEQLVEDLNLVKGTMITRQTYKNEGEKNAVWVNAAHKKQRKVGKQGGAYGNMAKFEYNKRWEEKQKKPSKPKSKTESYPDVDEVD